MNRRLRNILAGEDGPGRRALPAGELLHPATLAAVLVLVLNDHLLKGSAAPPWLTGKLSDVAGLVFFPLLLTAVIDVALLAAARLGVLPRADFSLRHGKLAAAIAATALIFTAIKLSPSAADTAQVAWSWLWPGARLVCDPSDLLALPALAAAWIIGRREIARVPLGRLEVIERAARRRAISGDALRRLVVTEMLDVGAPGLCASFADYLEGGDPAPAISALGLLRE